MSTDRPKDEEQPVWRLVEDAFDRAISLSAGEAREAFLNELTARSPLVAGEVRALLELETQASVLLGGFSETIRQFDAFALQPGEQVRHYRIVECLAAGGMGVVYRAHDVRLQRDVALKFLHPAYASDPERRRLFFNEARAASRLDHEHICAVYDIGETDAHQHYIVMALCPGADLGKILRQRALPLEEILRYAVQVADALAAAHRGGIVHRDLKPDNVIVDDRGRLKLVDFGIAVMARRDDAPSVPQTAGTIAYMAPEQLRGEDVDQRCDIWAIGVILYEALAGRRPFAGADWRALLRAMAHENPLAPGALVAGVPPGLDAIVERCLRRSAAERYASAAELGADLRQLQRTIADDPAASLAPAESGLTRVLRHATEPPAAPEGIRYMAVLAIRLTETATTDAWQDLMARFGGLPVRDSCECGLAVFGYPQADEFALHRAVRGGLFLADRGLAAAAAAGPAWVVAGGRPEPILGGDVFEQALSLARTGASGELRLTRAGHAHLQGYVRAEPVAAAPRTSSGTAASYRVVNEAPARGRLETFVAGELTPFVGRVHELGLLQEAWNRCLESDHPPILIAGEPGIGKSRVTYELTTWVSGRSNAATIEFLCSPHERASPLQPVSSYLLDALFGHGEAGAAPDRVERLTAFLHDHGLNEPQAQLAMLRLLALPEPESVVRASLTPEALKEKTLEALVRIIAMRAQREAALVIFEDLQWADPTTLELFERLQQIAARRMLIVGTHRPEFRPPRADAVEITRVGLAGLRKEHAARMLDSTLAGRSLDERRRAYALDKSEGNPLFIEELASALSEAGGRNTGEVPETLRGALLTRLDRLGDGKDLAQTAAVLGRQFDLPLLTASQGWSEARIETALRALLTGGLVLRQGYLPEVIYRFKHALIRDSAYELLDGAGRRVRHGHVAAALIERFPDRVARQPELAAYHYQEAGDPARAAEHWARAASQGLARFAVVETAEHARSGLEAVRSLPQSAEKLQLELRLQTVLGPALMATKGYADVEVSGVYSRARELCGALGNPPDVFPVLFGLWTFHCVRALHRDALELAEQLVALADSAGSAELATEGQMVRGITRYFQGEFLAARLDFAQAWSAYDPAESLTHIVRYGQDPGMVIRSYQSWNEWMLGETDAADRYSEEAVAIARRTQHPFSIAYGLTFAAWYALNRGRAEYAEQALAEAIALCREQKIKVFLALGLALDALRRIGVEPQKGFKAMEESLGIFTATGAGLFLPAWLGSMARAAFARSDLPAARALLADAKSRSERTEERWCLAELLRLEAEFAGEAGDTPQARAVLRRAARLAQRQGAAAWAARIAETRDRFPRSTTTTTPTEER